MRSSRQRQEQLRRAFRPERVQVLFVGESPPASGRFFYQGDSGLYRAMYQAFQLADASLSKAAFLIAFQRQGCYLIDLCAEPVDQLDMARRRAACEAGEPSLSKAIRRLQPKTIVTVVRSIEPNVSRACTRAGWTGELLNLPYPGRWARSRELFVESLAAKVRLLALASLKARA